MKTWAEIEKEFIELQKMQKRFEFLLKNEIVPKVDFYGNYFLVITNSKNKECVVDDFDVNRCIDKAMKLELKQ